MKTKGFTLIELLVVVAIIGILSSVVLANLQASREKAKVSAYNSYLSEVQKALELYKNDTGSYPDPTSGSGIPLATLIGTYLSNYISYQAYNYVSNPQYISQSLVNDFYMSCGREFSPSDTEPYIIMFESGLEGFESIYYDQSINPTRCSSMR